MKLIINNSTCIGCRLCETVCIRDNIKIIDKIAYELDNPNCFECGHCMAVCPTDSIRLIKYLGDEDRIHEYTSFNFEDGDFIHLLRQRRSTRWFKKDKVSHEMLNKLFEAVYYSPSAQNIQDVEFVVVEDKLDDFIRLVYDIICVEEDKFFRIKQLGEYLSNGCEGNHPLLWEGKQLILGFSSNKSNVLIANARLELYANLLGLGGFYSLFILKADELDHERFMGFFDDICVDKFLGSAFVIGYPRVKFKRSIPHDDVNVSFL